MSGDPEQEYFSDGISEDIITTFRKFRRCRWSQRNTSFTYKGRAVKVESVGRELCVDFILEAACAKPARVFASRGSSPAAMTEPIIWAERFDRDLTDISRSRTRLRTRSSSSSK